MKRPLTALSRSVIVYLVAGLDTAESRKTTPESYPLERDLNVLVPAMLQMLLCKDNQIENIFIS